MPILADVAAGPAFLLAGALTGAAVLLLIALGEAAVLALLRWASVWRALGDSLLVNMASALAGLLLYLLSTPEQVSVGYDPQQGGRLYETMPPIIPPVLALLLAWALSVVIEGSVLLLLKRRPHRQTWAAALMINVASYAVLGLLGLLTGALVSP